MTRRISRKRALILARKYDRLKEALRWDNPTQESGRPTLPHPVVLAVARASDSLMYAVSLLNDYAQTGRDR